MTMTVHQAHAYNLAANRQKHIDKTNWEKQFNRKKEAKEILKEWQIKAEDMLAKKWPGDPRLIVFFGVVEGIPVVANRYFRVLVKSAVPKGLRDKNGNLARSRFRNYVKSHNVPEIDKAKALDKMGHWKVKLRMRNVEEWDNINKVRKDKYGLEPVEFALDILRSYQEYQWLGAEYCPHCDRAYLREMDEVVE